MRVHLAGAHIAGFGLAAACLALSSPVFANGEQPKHLYLAVGLSTGAQVERFPMANGLPERQPDKIYYNVSMPMAIGPDGTFYATVPMSCCQGQAEINTYLPGSVSPDREVILPSLSDTTVATALAVGPGGYLYVGYDAFISGDRTRSLLTPQSSSIPMHGIAVYGPHANGDQPPEAAYKFPGIEFGPVALEFGPQGHLYAAGYDYPRTGPTRGFIFEVAQPWAGPNVVSRLDLGSVDAASIDFSDQTRDMYLLDWTHLKVLVYPRGAHGDQPPARSFNIANHLGPSLVIAGSNAFTSQFYAPSGQPEIIAYPKDSHGSPKPSFQRMVPNIASIEGLVIGL